MAIIFEKNFEDPNERIVRQFTNCCGASDKGTDYGVVCRGCYEPIEGYMADGADSQEEFENYIDNDSVLKRFRTFMNETFFNYEEWRFALEEDGRMTPEEIDEYIDSFNM